MAIASEEVWSPAWDFADRLRKARRHAGLSQEELAERLGVKTARLSGWEAGYNRPRDIVKTAEAIQDAIGVDAKWLLGLRDFGYKQMSDHLTVVPPMEVEEPEQLPLSFRTLTSK